MGCRRGLLFPAFPAGWLTPQALRLIVSGADRDAFHETPGPLARRSCDRWTFVLSMRPLGRPHREDALPVAQRVRSGRRE